MKNRFDNDTPGRRGFVWRLSGTWFSAASEWKPHLGMRSLDVDSGKIHDTLEEAYARAASLATKENTNA